MDELYELKEKLMKELKDYASNGKFSKEDVESIKYITSAIDHISNIADGDGYSGYYPYMGDGRSYRGGYSRKRDGMGRYSRDSLADKLRGLMDEAPDDHTRTEIKRLIDKM